MVKGLKGLHAQLRVHLPDPTHWSEDYHARAEQIRCLSWRLEQRDAAAQLSRPLGALGPLEARLAQSDRYSAFAAYFALAARYRLSPATA